MRPKAEWAIDSEPIRARGIFVKYCIKVNKTVLKWLIQISSRSYSIRFMIVYPYRMTRGSAFVLRLCRRNILWLVGALMLVILFHLYFIKGVKTITTRENDHFPPLPKEFLSPSHTKVSMNRLYHN